MRNPKAEDQLRDLSADGITFKILRKKQDSTGSRRTAEQMSDFQVLCRSVKLLYYDSVTKKNSKRKLGPRASEKK
jgi:hypothetical protein